MPRFRLPNHVSRCLLISAFVATCAGPFAAAQPLPRVPDGFSVELVAGPEQVRFPMFAAFDDRGRLFVAESSGLDLYKEITALTRKCRVSLLEDRDGDGRFESARVFQDQLVMPMGAMWHRGKLYVPDGPDLVTLEDTDGDGRADKRTVVLSGFGHYDNGGLHGPTFGADGWLYMTCGQPDGYRLKRPDGTWLEGKSGALVRCRPDGSDPQTIARGFENLVEAVFLPAGEVIGTVNWYQKPEGGIRDALVHLAHGGLYPYVPDVGTPLPVTGPVLPAVAKFPAVALSGMFMQQSTGLGAEFRGNLFSAQHNTRKVGRHVLERDGATFKSTDSDFLTSDDPDFHPSDVLEDADGSMLVVDTGSWYIHHCPTGQIRNSPATGGIYRVRRKGVEAPDDPRGLKIDWSAARPGDLTKLLADVRPPVRGRALEELALRGNAAVPALVRTLQMATDLPTVQRALWVLCPLNDESAGALLRSALGELERPDVVATAARALGSRGDGAAAAELCRLLKSEAPQVRFAAAEALAYCGGPEALPALWEALAAEPAPDAMLRHALVHALHRTADAPALTAALSHPSPRVQAAAMLLLDQPPRSKGALAADAAFERIASPDESRRTTALQRVEKHPEWASRAREVIAVAIGENASPEHDLRLHRLIPAFESDGSVQQLVSDALSGPRRRLLLETLQHSRLRQPPAGWVRALDRLLDDPDPAVRDQAVRTAAALQPKELDGRLATVAADESRPTSTRLEAVRAVVGRRPRLEPAAFDVLLSHLGARSDPAGRLAASSVLGRAKLDEAQARQLLAAVRGDAVISPAIVLPALKDVARAESIASELVDYVSDSLARGWEPAAEQLEELLSGLPESVRERADAARAKVHDATDRRRARLAEYEPLLAGGDPARGRAVFFGNKVACATCHRVGADGGQVGPDLTKVGTVRAGRDILESVVLPSSTFAQGYDAYVVQTSAGEVYAGTIPQPNADVLEIRDSAGNTTRLHKDQVKRISRQPVSIMPDGLAGALTKDEFRDLMAYLQSLK